MKEAAAAEVEVRTFLVKIDGRHAGEYSMTITHRDDGGFAMVGQANVRISYLVYHYTYWYRGTELWNQGRLVHLESSANDDGKQLAVRAAAEATGTRVSAAGPQRLAQGYVWPTTYWQLPMPEFRGSSMSILDADTGRVVAGALQYLGTTPLQVAGRAENCAHYRIVGELPADLWFDSHDRLVRQETMEGKHRSVLEVTSVRR